MNVAEHLVPFSTWVGRREVNQLQLQPCSHLVAKNNLKKFLPRIWKIPYLPKIHAAAFEWKLGGDFEDALLALAIHRNAVVNWAGRRLVHVPYFNVPQPFRLFVVGSARTFDLAEIRVRLRVCLKRACGVPADPKSYRYQAEAIVFGRKLLLPLVYKPIFTGHPLYLTTLRRQ